MTWIAGHGRYEQESTTLLLDTTSSFQFWDDASEFLHKCVLDSNIADSGWHLYMKPGVAFVLQVAAEVFFIEEV